ncbi:hypothetical protein TNCV_4779091 [Trichonephila clavipes]|nr:hypothetical protein TNCV_4779091 [Trichonephila clavipes]
MNVPLFKIPASEKELHKIILRLKNKVNDHPAAKNREEKTAAAVPPPPPPPFPVQRVVRRNEASIRTASLPPPSSLLENRSLPVLPLHPPHPPFRASS